MFERKMRGVNGMQKREGKECHTAESLLWRAERDEGRTGRTNRWRGDK